MTTTVRAALANPKLRVRLLAFARSLFMEEIPLFFLQAEAYEQARVHPLCDPATASNMAKAIFANYLAKGCEKEVMLSPKERARVGEVLRTGGVPDLGPLKNEAESVMTASLLQPFLAKVYSLSRSLSSGASLLDDERSDSSAADKERRRQTHQLLVTLLLEPKNREVLFALLAARAEEESGELAPAATELLLLQDGGGCEALLGFLDYSARREVALTRDPNTLFRQRGVLVAIFADLLTRLPCRLWLAAICAKAVKVARRSDSAVRAAAAILRSLGKRAAEAPPVFSRLLFLISQASASSFPAMRFRVVASFVFLRCVGPVLVDPVPLLSAEPLKPSAQAALRGALRLLLCKSAEDDGQRTLEADEAAFVKSDPSVESLMHLLIDREARGDESSKATQVLGPRKRSGSVTVRPPHMSGAEEERDKRSPATAQPGSPTTPLALPAQRRSERSHSFSQGLHTIRALFSPNSTPRLPEEPALASGASGSSFAASMELVRGSGSISASPAASPRGLTRSAPPGECVEEQLAGLRQLLVNGLLTEWTQVRAGLSPEQLGEPSLQWLEAVLGGLMS